MYLDCDYYWDFIERKYYKIDQRGYLYRFNTTLYTWKNVSGTVDFSLANTESFETEAFFEKMIENFIINKFDKDVPHIGEGFNLYNTNKGIVLIDITNAAFLLIKDGITKLTNKAKISSDYSKVSYEEAYNVIMGKDLGFYSINEMISYKEKDDIFHMYADDGCHFVISYPNKMLYYVDNNKPLDSYTLLGCNTNKIPSDLKDSLILPRCYLPELKALTEYSTSVIGKYNEKHPNDKITSLLDFYEDIFGKIYARDINDIFYECKKTSIKKIGKGDSFYSANLIWIHNMEVVSAINHYANRRTQVKKGNITVYDICWYDRKDDEFEGVSEEGEVYLLTENGEIEKQNRTKDITTIQLSDVFSMQYIVHIQADNKLLALLDDCKKTWRNILLKQNIKLGNKFKFYGEPMKNEDKYILHMKDENGRNYRVTPNNIFVEDNNTITSDFIEIKSSVAVKSILKLDDPFLNALRGLASFGAKYCKK